MYNVSRVFVLGTECNTVEIGRIVTALWTPNKIFKNLFSILVSKFTNAFHTMQ